MHSGDSSPSGGAFSADSMWQRGSSAHPPVGPWVGPGYAQMAIRSKSESGSEGSEDRLGEALEAGADRILLDNADAETVKRAVDMVGDRVPLEVSGGMTVERVREIAGLGRLLISVGRITHSAPALDISLDLQPA